MPLIVVSPWARRGYVSNVVQDHTSLAAFLEHKWNLPAMTFRDANAAPMTDYFDFSRPAFAHPPRLAAAPGSAPAWPPATRRASTRRCPRLSEPSRAAWSPYAGGGESPG